MVKFGIISGSGLDFLSTISHGEMLDYNSNRYGKTSSKYTVYRLGDIEIYSLKRHGENHEFNPTKINYRANICGFKELGVENIIAFGSSGAIDKRYKIGSLILLDNAIDFTKLRINTFYENKAVHVDMSNPFCASLRSKILSLAKSEAVDITDRGVAICTEGPRLETAAEIEYFKLIGADTVGMTLFPEVTLAREQNLCYLSIAVICNYAAGISRSKITVDELNESSKLAKKSIERLIKGFAKVTNYNRDCNCSKSTDGAEF